MADAKACPGCGTANGAAAVACMGCGVPLRLPPLRLVGLGGGPSLRTTQPLKVGRALLKQFGADSQFAAEPQFELVPDVEARAWRVLACAGARNATCYAGVPVGPDGALVETGGVVEIGPGKLKLRVELEGA